MSFMNIIGKEEINRRKTVSGQQDKGNQLTVKLDRLSSSHGKAARKNRNRISNREISDLESLDVNSADYYNDLEC